MHSCTPSPLILCVCAATSLGRVLVYFQSFCSIMMTPIRKPNLTRGRCACHQNMFQPPPFIFKALRTRMRTRMRTWSLVVLALWFLTLCPEPVKATGSETMEVITHTSDAANGSSRRTSGTYKGDAVLSSSYRVLMGRQLWRL